MKRHNVCLAGLILAGVVMSGCADGEAPRQSAPASPDVAQGMLGDLNTYIHQLLSQRGTGDGQAEKTLERLLNGKGLPESAALSSAERGK